MVTRRGRRLAMLGPASAAVGNGTALKEFLASHHPDPVAAEDVASARYRRV